MTFVPKPRITRRTPITIAGSLLAIGCLGWWGWVPSSFTNDACRLSGNGAWIGVEWTSKPIDPLAVAELADQIRARQIRYVYPFTTYVKADGSWSPSYSYAQTFVTMFRQHNQQTAVLGWIGLPAQHVDFTNQQARARIIDFLTTLTTDTGFDGLHINAEPIPNGDLAYLQFLQELRTELSPRYMLSIASLPWASAIETAVAPNNPYRWSSDYYRAIAAHVDQIAAMTYDSHAASAALYRLWMREQVAGIRRSIADTPISLLIGISVSREATASHHPAVESLPQGLAGLCAATTRYRVDRIDGVALYALWEADAQDWQIWEAWQHGAKEQP